MLIIESVFDNSDVCLGEDGTTLVGGTISDLGDTMDGVWLFQFGANSGTPDESCAGQLEELPNSCGTFSAMRVEELPAGPCIVNLAASELQIDDSAYADIGAIEVTDLSYRVAYSILTRPVDVHFVLSTDDQLNVDDLILDGAFTILPGPDGALGRHGRQGPVLEVPRPANCDPHYILMVIDAAGSLDETDETDNTIAQRFFPCGD
jgi:hypothetical protein